MPKSSSQEALFRMPTLYGHDIRSQEWAASYSKPKDPVPEGELLLFVALFHPFTVRTSIINCP